MLKGRTWTKRQRAPERLHTDMRTDRPTVNVPLPRAISYLQAPITSRCEKDKCVGLVGHVTRPEERADSRSQYIVCAAALAGATHDNDPPGVVTDELHQIQSTHLSTHDNQIGPSA